MENVLKLTSPIPPSVNHFLSYRAIMKNGRPMAMSYKTPEAVKYQARFKQYVIDEVAKQGWVKSDNKYQHYYMDSYFYFPRVDMDANNYFKCLADAITESGVVWVDDNQLCERVQGVYYDSKNPRVEFVIRPVNYIGIFKDGSQLEAFNSNCIECSRYSRNCSVLKNALEGRVQETVIEDNDILCCSKFKKIKK